jgi:hypothetical protein
MAKDTTADNEKPGKQSGEGDRGKRVVAAEKRPAKKKAAKKTSKKKAVTKKKSTASSAAAASASAPQIAAPQPAATPAPKAEPAFAAPAEDEHSGGGMRGIVALWGPLAIIVLLIVVSRVNDEQAAAPGGLTASLESAESIARGVVEDVQDALSGGDPQAAALESGITGQSVTGNSKSALAAAFDDSGVNAIPAAPKPAATAAEPWGPSDQSTTPASVSGIPAALPPEPENPWAPVDPGALTAMPGSGAPPGPGYGAYGGMPPGAMHQGSAPHGQGYAHQGQGYGHQGQGYGHQGQGYGHQGQGYPPQGQGYPPQGQDYPPQGQGYPPQGQGYPPQGQGYGSAPPQAYPRQQAYGSPPPYAYPPQPYGTPPPYGPGYYPPAQ